MDISQVVIISAVALLMHACQLMCHPTSWYSYNRVYLPGPQFCPDTGRTVCTSVDYYPTDQIFHLLTSARSQVFNLTSVFVDEREGDVEPNIAQLPTDPPQDAYGYSQQPPSGRISSAGRNAWRPTSSEKPPNYGRNLERWGQTGRPTVQNNQRPTNNWRQSRAQNLPNQRRDSRTMRIPSGPSGYNNNIPPPLPQQGYNSGDRSQFVTQHNRVEIQDVFTNVPPSVPSNFSGYIPQRPQGIYQMQPPYARHNVKGHISPVPARPQIDGNWKGSPDRGLSYSTKASVDGDAYQGSYNRRHGRDRRNEDTEEACNVRTTYIPPRAALNDKSEWKYVINVPERNERFSQVIRVDVCLNEGSPCSSRLSLPFGFESRCRQKYIKKRLLSLNPDGQGTAEDSFFIPSCCVCEIRRINRTK